MIMDEVTVHIEVSDEIEIESITTEIRLPIFYVYNASI